MKKKPSLEGNRHILSEAEGQTLDQVIEILSNTVNTLQELGDEAGAKMMASAEGDGMDESLQEEISGDVQSANDILTNLLAKLEKRE